jgi:hypothetical protein
MVMPPKRLYISITDIRYCLKTVAAINPNLTFPRYRNVCSKELLGVLSGKKAPVGAGTFFPDTPLVRFSAYISEFIVQQIPVSLPSSSSLCTFASLRLCESDKLGFIFSRNLRITGKGDNSS